MLTEMEEPALGKQAAAFAQFSQPPPNADYTTHYPDQHQHHHHNYHHYQHQQQHQHPQQHYYGQEHHHRPFHQFSGHLVGSTMSVMAEQQSTGNYYETPVNRFNHTSLSNLALNYRTVPRYEGSVWSMITYHEYSVHVGPSFYASHSTIFVDGYTYPLCADRFCTGAISNSNRNLFTEWVRRRFGRGVRIIYDNRGDVYMESLTEASIFVNDPLQAYMDKGVLMERVLKLNPGSPSPVRVFSSEQFSKLLNDAFVQGYEAVFDLTNRCAIRASIAKGWGPEYRRESITQTPCWFEILMTGPLQWIDRALRQLKPPIATCGSNT